MLKKLSTILSAKELRKFKLILALNFLMFILEALSIISIPLFASALIDPILVVNKISFYFPESYFLYLDASNILYISSGFVIISFLLKNSFLLFLLYWQGHFFKDIQINISRKLFNYYVYLPYLEHVEKDPSTLARNITNETQLLNTYLMELAVFIRESSAVLVIFLILIGIQPFITLLVCFLFSLIGLLYLKLVKPFVKNRAEQNQLLSKNIFQIIYETFGSIKDLKILMKEAKIINYFDKDIKIFEKNNFYFSVIARLPKILLELIAVITITVITLIFFNFNQDYSKFFPMLSLIVICVFRSTFSCTKTKIKSLSYQHKQSFVYNNTILVQIVFVQETVCLYTKTNSFFFTETNKLGLISTWLIKSNPLIVMMIYMNLFLIN